MTYNKSMNYKISILRKDEYAEDFLLAGDLENLARKQRNEWRGFVGGVFCKKSTIHEFMIAFMEARSMCQIKPEALVIIVEMEEGE